MRDQAYFKRLNDIRSKYGHLHELAKLPTPHQRQSVPNAPFLTHNYSSTFETPLKSKENQLNCHTSYQAKELRQDRSRPSIGLNSYKARERPYSERQNNQQNVPKYHPQPYQQQSSIPKNPPSNNQSPIKMLKELSANPHLPISQPTNLNDQSLPLTLKMKRGSGRTQSNFTQRTFITSNNYETKQGQHRMSIRPPLPERCYTPTSFTNPAYEPTTKQTPNEQFQSNYTASLNNIDKIQEKIRGVLNSKGRK